MSVAVVTALALAVGFRLPVAQLGPPPIVQPETYLSPSGRLELVVDPRQRDGRGAAAMQLLRDGNLVWERECDVTLVDAHLFEDGSVAGYAYPGDLVLLFLSPTGQERARFRLERGTRLVHGLPKPNVSSFERRKLPDGVTFRLDSGSDRHFSFDGRESIAEVGQRAEPQLERKPTLFLPLPEEPLELLELSRVRLLFTPVKTYGRGPLPRFITRTGAILLNEFEGALHVFGPDGRRTVLCLPDPGDPTHYRPYDHLDIDADGVYHAYNNEVHLQFGPEGERRSADLIRSERSSEHCLPSGGRWLIGMSQLVLRREGVEDLIVERSAAGRWFRHISAAAVASDGLFAVMDEGSEDWANDGCPEAFLQLYEPDGRPRASILFDPASKFYPLAARPDEVALLDESTLEIRAVSTDGSRCGRARLPEGLTKPGPISYSPYGRELWILDHELTLHRFELRWR